MTGTSTAVGEPAPSGAGSRGRLARACAAAFIASFCTMVIELVAARIMAPYVGVSLYTWTSIIGVILGGISLGAWAGGEIADRFPRPSTLGWLLFASGLSALAAAPIASGIGATIMAGSFAGSLVQRVLLLSAAAFFLPSLLLGMISPVTVKLALRSLDRSGGVVGKIYAFSTLGAILGTFATGFVLIALMGTRAILLATAALLILTAIALGRPGARSLVAALALAFGGTAILQLPAAAAALDPYVRPASSGDYLFRESEYYTIRLQQASAPGGGWVEVLVLDHLVHSFNSLRDPGYLFYGYLKVFDAILKWKESESAAPRALFLGGGGYTLPRLVAESRPSVGIDVVEIDPEVTRTAVEWLGVPGERIRTTNADARWFVMNATSSWDVIFGDAFNDLSIPFHLTTLEFDRDLARILSGGGVLASNVIDDYGRGKFLPAYLATMRRAFGAGNVALAGEPFALDHETQATFVVIASRDAAALERLLRFLETLSARGDVPLLVRRPEEIDRYLAQRQPVVLTDDYAPVDNLVAPLFAERYRYRAQ